MTGFQTQVNTLPAPAVAGDFASTNPRASAIAGPGGFVAGAGGVTVARFAWVDAGDLKTVRNYGSGAPAGFVHREQQTLITTYLAESSMVVPEGFGMTLMIAGDYWVKNDGSTQAVPGMKAYAEYGTGKISFAATGAPSTGGSATGSIAASTGSFTGTIVDNILTITAVTSGVVVVGGTLSGTNVASGTMVTEQLSGTAGGIGTYAVNIGGQAVTSTTISETYGTFTAASALSGAFTLGGTLSGSGVTSGTIITAFGTGTGGLGTYIVSPTQTAASTTITEAGNIETKYYARSSGAAGELVIMSSLPQG